MLKSPAENCRSFMAGMGEYRSQDLHKHLQTPNWMTTFFPQFSPSSRTEITSRSGMFPISPIPKKGSMFLTELMCPIVPRLRQGSARANRTSVESWGREKQRRAKETSRLRTYRRGGKHRWKTGIG